jgi:hypothetical protein
MTHAQWCIAVVLLTLTLTGGHVAPAQVGVKADDLSGP